MEAMATHMESSFLISEDHEEVWSQIKRMWLVKRKLPTVSVLIEKIDKRNTKGQFDKQIDILIDIRNSIPELDVMEVMGELESYIKDRAFVKLMEEVADEFTLRDRAKAQRVLVEESKKIHELKIFNEVEDTVFDGFLDRQLERELDTQKGTLIPTCWPLLDRINGGGHWTGELECWLGDSGAGKSKCLVSRAIQTASMGYDVLHVQLEGTREQAMTNYDSAWSRISYADFRFRRFESDELKSRIAKIKKESRKWLIAGRGEIIVKSVETFNGMSTDELHSLVRDMKQKHPNIKQVVVDYAELLVLKNFVGVEHERLIKIMRDLKNIAIEFDVLVTTATQSADIKTEDKDNPQFVITRHNIGKSKRIIEPLSYFYTINQTRDEAENSIARIYVDKLRESASRQTIRIRQNLWRSEFYAKVATNQLQAEFIDDTDIRERQSRQETVTELTDLDNISAFDE